MDKIMRIGGKSPSNKAVGVAVTDNGEVKVKHIWEIVSESLSNEVISDTSPHYYPSATTNLDVSDFALISIYVNNATDAPVTLILCDKGSYIKDSANNTQQVTINAGNIVVLTADDFPCLNVIPSFSIRAKFNVAPTNSGKLFIKVYKKR